LAHVYSDLKQTAKAGEYFRESLQINELFYGKNHAEFAESLVNFAGFNISLGELDKAGFLFEEATGIFERNLGNTHPKVAICLSNLAGLRMKQDKLLSALSLCQKSQSTIK